MSIRLQHFYFTGDGRSDGTEQASSGLGDAQTLAVNIVCNVAQLLINAGWESVKTNYLGTTCNKKYTIDNEHIINIDVDTTNFAVEVPLKYTTAIGDTKAYILYSYSDNSSANRNGILKHLGDTSVVMSWAYTGTSASHTVPRGLSILYIPPTCVAGEYMKISSMASGDNNSTGYLTLPYQNTNNNIYNFNVITQDDTIAIILQNSSWTYNRFKGYCYGSLINELYDTLDISSESYSCQKYIGFSFGERYNTHEGSSVNTNNGKLGHLRSYYDEHANTPMIQYYNSSGEIVVCNNTSTQYNWLGNNKSLFTDNRKILCGLNFNKTKNLTYSDILIGGIRSCSAINYPAGQPEVSPGNYIKGKLDSNWFRSIGTANDSGDASDNRPIGQTYEDKKFVHLGGGILIGWDENGKGLLENSDNQMIAATEIQQ